jgi:hypothetical protein
MTGFRISLRKVYDVSRTEEVLVCTEEKIIMKKRVLSFLTSAMVMTLCLSGCNGKSQSDNTGVDTDATSVEAGENAPQAEEAGSDTGNSEKDAEATQSGTSEESEYETPFTVVNHGVSSKADGAEKATGSYPEIILSKDYKDNYPKLYEYIQDQNENWKKIVPETVANYAVWRINDTFYEDEVYSSEINVTIVRADDRIFSMLLSFYDFAGGAHPSHYTTSVNVDPVSGAELKLSQVLNDTTGFSEAIRQKLEEGYPGIMEEVDSFYFMNDGDDPDQFVDKLKKDTYSWTITGDGLTLYFSPYEIASYAAGYMEVVLPVSEYPNLIQKAYQIGENQDMDKLVQVVTGDSIEVEPMEEDYSDSSGISNPSWKKYISENAAPAAGRHISLSKTLEDKYDWLDTGVWADKNGFTVASLPYSDGTYFYQGENPVEYDYMYNELYIYNSDQSELIYDLNLYELCNGPDAEEGRYSSTTEYLNWAQLYEGTLYISTVHAGYASENPWSNYIVAIDPEAKEVLWRSAPLTNNASNFLIVDDTIICGYGFTAEPDYIYLLDRFTGDEVDKIKVNSAPYQFEIVGDTLYVATYNTAYEFRIGR